MSKKLKKSTTKSSPTAGLLTSVRRLQETVGAHAFVIVFILGGIAIGYSLIHARAYLSPARDDAHYDEGVAKSNYSKVDQTVLNKLKLTQNDKDNKVNQSLAPNRSNPFNE